MTGNLGTKLAAICREADEPAAAVRIVDECLAEAIAAEASDVHFEPTGDKLLIRCRLDGALTVVGEVPADLAANVVSRLKVMGGLLTYRNDIPQEGRIELPASAEAKVGDLRLAVFPTIHGQRAVVRMFYEHEQLAHLDSLGFEDSVRAGLSRLALSDQGVVLVTGPAGSGKSTTLAAMVRHVVARYPGKSVVTLEDPVERRIAGATQVEIAPHGEMTFPVALRSLLRQDPQVLMIGEIRDRQTAAIAIEAGMTGHLLMSTLHAGMPAAALLRLIEMGLEPYQITSSVKAVLNQRLLRRLCDKCKRPLAGSTRAEPVGCEACFGTGYHGRMLIAELMEMDGPLRSAVLDKADLDQLQRVLRDRGHQSLRCHGRELVARGETTETELDRVCGRSDDGDL